MKQISEFSRMLEQIQQERGIPKEALVEAIRQALISASRKKLKAEENLDVILDDVGNFKVMLKKEIVNTVENESVQISKKDAKQYTKSPKLGEFVELEVTPKDFGRIAAQTAKQVIIQRIREAEKEEAFDEFLTKKDNIITGTIQRQERGGVLINLGRIETLLTPHDQIRGEMYRPKDKIKVYVVDVQQSSRGPFVRISRSHPGLVQRLFELEVPEINEGILEIKEIAREAGRRSKVAVFSNDSNVAAVGTCVGHMGVRIQNIVRELGNERVDIVEWSNKTEKFISNALSPAKISKVELNETAEGKIAKVFVPEDQLSLAIGREGQNVRLAAKLTGWKIDIVNQNAPVEAKDKEQIVKDEEVKTGEGITKKKVKNNESTDQKLEEKVEEKADKE